MKKRNAPLSRSERSNRTKRVAVSGVLVALGVIILYIGSIVEVLNISMAAIASLICVIAVIEYGRLYPIMIFAATSIIAMLLLPEKLTPSIYALLIGYYPILKELIERIGKKSMSRRLMIPIHYALKLVFFNAALFVVVMVAIHVLILPESAEWLKILTFLLANATFLVYDLALTRMISMYVFRLRSRFKLPGGRG